MGRLYDLRSRDSAFLARLVELAPESVQGQTTLVFDHRQTGGYITGPSEYYSGHPGLVEYGEGVSINVENIWGLNATASEVTTDGSDTDRSVLDGLLDSIFDGSY